MNSKINTSMIKSSWFSLRNDIVNNKSDNNINDDNNNPYNLKDDKDDKDDKETSNFFNIFEIDSDKIQKKIENLEKRTEICENIYNNILQTLNDLKTNIENLENKDKELKEEIDKLGVKLKANETACNVIKNDNLKLINRILEAEISVERTTNILLRKHISFPFTPLSNKLNL